MTIKQLPVAAGRKPRINNGTLRQKAWRAMQIKHKFTLADLVRNTVPSESSYKDPRNNIWRYVRALTQVGILVEMKRRMPPASGIGIREKRWMLVRDLGRKAPVVRDKGCVFDPNSGAIFGADGVNDEGSGHAQ